MPDTFLPVVPPPGLRRLLPLIAPGTPLRDGLDRILRGRTGALVVLGTNKVVSQISTGGFALDVPYTPTNLRELAKMDGAIIFDVDNHRLVAAGVHLMPDAAIQTAETGTRHRTADRVSRQTELPVLSVSASMSTISLYLGGYRHLVEHSEETLSRANQALQAQERYRQRLVQLVSRLSTLEVEDQVSVRDVAVVAQRLEMIRRLQDELDSYVLELGVHGRLLTLQLEELQVGLSELSSLLAEDYREAAGGRLELESLASLGNAELLDPLAVARHLGFVGTEHLDTRVHPQGLRQLAQISRLPAGIAQRLLHHFGTLQALFAASTHELLTVEGVGEGRARIIRDGLTRLAESAITDRFD